MSKPKPVTRAVERVAKEMRSVLGWANDLHPEDLERFDRLAKWHLAQVRRADRRGRARAKKAGAERGLPPAGGGK